MELTLAPWESIFNLIDRLLSKKIEDRKRFFEEHIEPSFHMIEAIHNDYMCTFNELSKMIAGEEWTTERIADWLKKRKLEYESQRTRIHSLPTELEYSDFYKKAAASISKKDLGIYEASFEFTERIVSYFTLSNTLTASTWYTGFIEILESKARRDSVTRMELNTKPRQLVTSRLRSHDRDLPKNLVNEYLPKKFKAVCDQYAKLRGMCLS
jgi:hypothetical protein